MKFSLSGVWEVLYPNKLNPVYWKHHGSKRKNRRGRKKNK